MSAKKGISRLPLLSKNRGEAGGVEKLKMPEIFRPNNNVNSQRNTVLTNGEVAYERVVKRIRVPEEKWPRGSHVAREKT